MTDLAPSAPAAPSTDTQAAINAIFNQAPIDRDMAPVSTILVSPEQPQANPDATAPADPTNPLQQPQAAPVVLDQNGQPLPPVIDTRTQAPNMVPGSRLKEEADRRRAEATRAVEAERRAAYLEGQLQALSQSQQQAQQQQPPPAPVDPNPLPPQFRNATDFMIGDPDGFVAWNQNGARIAARQEAEKANSQIEARFQKLNWKSDDQQARATYGSEYVDQVKAHVQANPQLAKHFSQFPDPYTKAVQWARDQQVRQAIPNGDINAARVNWLREALANPELLREIAPHLAGGQPASASPSSVPPSLGSLPRANGTGPIMNTGDAIQALFASRRG